jgi:prevent-host-death family protein
MRDTVGIAQLKSRLSEYLRAVRRGRVLTIMDRDTPVARIVPVQSGSALTIRAPAPGARGPASIRLPAPIDLDVDIDSLLAEERGER